MLNQRWYSIIIKFDVAIKAIGKWFHNNFKVGFKIHLFNFIGFNLDSHHLNNKKLFNNSEWWKWGLLGMFQQGCN